MRLLLCRKVVFSVLRISVLSLRLLIGLSTL